MSLDPKIRKAAIEALATISKYDREKFSHGINRIRLYYSDVDGDWLETFKDDELEYKSTSTKPSSEAVGSKKRG